MPISANNENENNKKFIKKFFPDEDVNLSYPDFNYRVRMAELTNFWPYYSEAAKDSSETQLQYEARVNTSGRLFGSQYIVLNDIVHHDMDVSGMIIGQDYAGHLPEALFYIEKCKLLPGGKEYEVRPKNLNDENFLITGPPQVIFPVDLSKDDKGYYCYRKTSAVQKNNNKLVEVQSGWEKVAEFSNNDVKNYIAGVDLGDEKRNMGFSFIDSGISGYSGWTNELMTSYKILDSGSVENVSDDTYYLRKSRTVNYISDPNKTYTLERKISRASNNSTTNPPAWELLSPQAEFPYTDTEVLSNIVTGAVDFKVSGVYEVVKPAGYFAESDLDYFQIDLIEDWGKSKKEDYTFGQDSKELTFESGEAVRVVQKANSSYTPYPYESHNILGVLETSFSPNSTGVSGSITGSGNAENFYELEYQLVPKEREFKKLYYETGAFDGISVGDRVFFNSGASQEGDYTSIETNIFGDSVSELDSRSPIAEEVSKVTKEEYIGPSYISGMFHTIEPEEASNDESSGVGWSYYSSGEKYLVVPKGGYNSLDLNPRGDGDRSLVSYSAGEVRSTFYQGHQTWGNEETQYALTEYRSFDPVDNTEDPYVFNKEKEIRISDQALCLGESATELPDKKNPTKVFLLDFEYGSDQIFRNASILNIDFTNGSVGISNLKSNKEEFERKPNLFFEKQYIGSLTILATGQKQDHDVSTLKEMISTERASDASVFYLERDIYIDSDISTQSNFISPTVFSTGLGGASDPFALSENSANPSVRGEEKLYLTETYHKNPKEYPFTDSSYFIKRPVITETFEYAESAGYEEKNFSLTNIENESTYTPNYFNCSLGYEKTDALSVDGYGLLSYLGVSLTGSASVSDITIAGTDAGKRSIAFTPLNTGVYYEIQARYTDSSYNWTDVSPAIDIHDGMLDANGSASIALENSAIFTASDTNLEIRALEWNKSSVNTAINAQRVTNESPDSLILKSEASDVFYDWSKLEHKVTNHGTVVSAATSAGDIFPSVVSNVVDLTSATDNSKYLSFASHRSFDIQNGDFSMEFWVNCSNSSYGSSRNNYIIKRSGGFEASIDSSNKIQFIIGGYTLSSSFAKDDWVHIAISANFNRRSSQMDLSLFVGGDLIDSFSKPATGNSEDVKVVGFGELSAGGDGELIMGQGFKGKLYGVRIYIGKSNYNKVVVVPTAPFEKEASPRAYKILKYQSKREVSPECDWIMNKNTFNNVSPPWQYKDVSDDAEPFFMSEWMGASSTTEEMGSKYNRALINYISNYAYRAPNNPHINKNYEGTPIEKASDLDPRTEITDTDGKVVVRGNIVFDNYRYIDKNKSSSKKVQAAPYLYEYIKESDLDLIRQRNKGGYDMPLVDKSESAAFNEGSRLRITKYVYKLYTKRAVVVADVGYKNNRGHQSGWAYQLQYSTDGGSSWADVDSDAVSQAQNIFYNNEYTLDVSPDGFGNISSFNSLPVVLLKSDITKKYKTNAIQFRIRKEQNINLGNSADTGKVLKKLNFLPLEVDIPSSGCLLDMTQQDEHSTVIGGARWTEVKLDKDTTYILIKDSDEEILEPSNSISISSITETEGTATATTSAAHYLQTGDVVNITGATPTAYNGSFEVVVFGEGEFLFKIAVGTGSASGAVIAYRTGVDKLKINSLTFNEGEANLTDDYYGNDLIKDNFTDLPNGQPVEFKGLTGLRISGSSLNSLEDIKTVVAPKPSGITLNRVEKSYKGKSSDGYIRTGEFFSLGFGGTKAFITPSVTGSHFDELDDFNKFANQPEDPTNSSLVNFSCKSYTTGEGQVAEDEEGNVTLTHPSIETGVSGVKFAPLNQFYNSPVITGDITVGEEDAGKTFITSGDLTFNLKQSLVDNVSSIAIANIAGDLDGAGENLDDATIAAETPIPTATLENTDDIVIIQDSGRVNIANWDSTESTGIVNIFTGDVSNIKLNNNLSVNENVVFVEHGKINLTEDDVGETIVVDCASDVILPDGFSNADEITFINGTKYETKVLSENPSHTIGTSSNIINYIPREVARKYTYNTSNDNWSASDVDIIKFNQLNLTHSDFSTTGNTIVHNEDVDVRITSANIINGDYLNIVRNQVNDFDIEDDLTDWSTPIIRVYVDGALKHVAPSGSLGVRISYETSGGWKFKKIRPIILNEVVITPSSGGKIFSYNGNEDSISVKFSDGFYPSNFKIFLVSNQEFLTNISIDAYSEDESVKFLNKDGEDIGWRIEMPMDKRSVVSVSKEPEGLNFTIKAENQSNIYKFDQPIDSSTRVKINRNENFGLELPTITEEFVNERGFDLIFCNFSESSCISKTPTEDVFRPDSNIPSFKSRNYKYINPRTLSSSYDRFKDTSKIKDSSTSLNDGDFVVLDGSVADPRLRSFVGLSGEKREHKFSEAKLRRDFNLDGEVAKYIAFDHGTDQFTLKNHELSTGQKLVFNCDKLFVADHYYDASSTAFSGAGVSAGQSVLIFKHYDDANYSLFTWDGSALKQQRIDLPEFYMGSFGTAYQVEPGSVAEEDRLFVYIKNLDKVYDFGHSNNKTGLSTEKTLATRIPFSLTIDEEDDMSVTKKQTFFVEVVDDNKFKLYKDSSRTTQLIKTVAITLLSETFHVEDINIGSLNVLNLGDSDTGIKNYSEEMDIVSPLATLKEATIHQHSSSVYTSGDAVASGVYLATGWNGTSDTLDIDNLAGQNTVFLSGKFHAKADLGSGPLVLDEDENSPTWGEEIPSNTFDNSYYVNVGLDEAVITNTEEYEEEWVYASYEDERTIPTSHPTSVSFGATTDYADLGWLVGQVVEVKEWDNQVSSFKATIVSYNNSTGAITLSSISNVGTAETSSNWVLNLTSVSRTLKKNRAYKHTGNGLLVEQDQNSSSANASDIIYYPKNELHVLDRKTLSKDDAQQDYNFVFFKPDKHSDDLKVVLPNTWSNLDSSEQIGFAVVNLHNRAVTVSNFTGDQTFNLSADTVVFMTSATDYSAKEEHNLYDNIIKTKWGDQYNITLGGEVYKFVLDEDSKEAQVLQDRPNVTDYWAYYYILKPGDITIDHSIHHGKKIFIDGPINFLRPYLSSKDGNTDYSGEEYDNQTTKPTSFQIANISRDPVDVYIDGEVPTYTASQETVASDDNDKQVMHSSQFYSVEINAFEISEDVNEYFKHFTLERASSAAGSFEYPATNLDSTKAYNVFGVELPIKLNVYTSILDTGDAEKINIMFNLEQAGGQIEAENYYKVSGIGATDIPKLNIVNSVYEDVRISSVSVKGDLVEDETLEKKIKKVFDDMQVPIQNAFSSYVISGTEISEVFPESLTPKLLGKNKALGISLAEMVDIQPGKDGYNCSAIDSETLDLPGEVLSTEHAFLSDLIKTSKQEVKTLKKETIDASLADAVFGDTSFARSITCTSDPFDIALPNRRLIGGKDFDFILVNASWSDIAVVFPEGVGSSFSIPKGETKKVSYDSGSKTYGSEVAVTTEVLNKGLYSTDLDVFLINDGTTESKPYKIKEGNRETRIINNTNGILYLQGMGGGTNRTVDKYSYTKFRFIQTSSIDEIIPDQHDVNVELTKIRDGAVLLGETYTNEVVLFNSDRIYLLDFIRKPRSVDKFFKTDLVPFINDTKFRRGDLTRTKDYVGSYTIRNQKPSPDQETIVHLSPVKLAANGTKTLLDVSCHLFEFILENIDGKVAYPNKDYDYIIKNSANFSCILYNGRIGFNGGTYFYRLDASGNVIYGTDEGDNKILRTSYSAEGKPVFNISQSGTGVTSVQGQAYSDQKYQGTEVKQSGDWEDSLDSKLFLYQKFYLNKASYNGKVIIFKDPFDVVYSTISGNDYYYDKASATRLVNIAKEASCYRNLSLGGGGELESEWYMSASEDWESAGVSFPIVRPKYTLVPDADKLHVLRHLADVEQTSINNLKIANVSRGAISIGYPDECDNNLKWKVFSSERADFSNDPWDEQAGGRRFDQYESSKGPINPNNEKRPIIKMDWRIDEPNPPTEPDEPTKPPVPKRQDPLPALPCDTEQVYVKYSEVRRQDKRDWFVRLVDLDVPHLIKDSSYFNEKEYEMELKTEQFGRINVDYSGVRFKFSNIFGTNKMHFQEFQTGFQSIEDYDDPYRFGITLLSNRRGVQREIFWEKDVSDKFFPVYLKLPWDMPADIIAYMLSTGHERLSRCLHFNERNGEITLGGIKPDKYYSLRSESLSSYDFTHDATQTIVAGQQDRNYNDKDYIRSLKGVVFRPKLIYNNRAYFSGEKIEGGSLSEYRVSYPYFSALNVSQFSVEGLGDSDIQEKVRKEEKEEMQDEVSDETRLKGRNIDVDSITEDSGTATATTLENHSLQTGSTVTISGATPEAYNASFEVAVTGDTTFTFSIEEGTGDTSEEATIVANVKDLDLIVFSWSKVSQDSHENDFLSGRVESIATYDLSAKQELIQGRKIKDIKGSYEKELWKYGGDKSVDEDGTALEEVDESYWKTSRFFKFTIPLRVGFTYSKEDTPYEKIIIRDKAENEKPIGLAEEGDVAEVTIHFSVKDINKYVELPGLEYGVSASLTYNRSDLQTAGGTNVKAAQISLEPKDSMPFVADGHISSLNEDFASPDADEYTLKSLESLRRKEKNKTKDETWKDKVTSLREYTLKSLDSSEAYTKAFNAITSLSSNQVYQSLKNNLGYSFAPAFGITSGNDPMVGLRFNLKRNLGSYRAIRFRLKKLTDRRIIFDDLTKDEKIGSYLTDNATEANLQYQLDTSVNSIAYHDIAHPGGVATAPDPKWKDVELSGSDLELEKHADGDAIIFKEDSGEIKAGKVYFIRINNVAGDVYKVDVLKIYCDSSSSLQNFNSFIKVNGDLSEGTQKYKIVNYFNLSKKNGELDHRGWSPVINKLYPDTELAKGSTLTFPIIIGSKKFYLERAVYKDPGATTEFATWADTVWEKEGAGFRVRANLEMSEIAQTFISDFKTPDDMEAFLTSASYWNDEDIFNGVKNLLYRSNTQIQLVNWYKSGKSIIIKVNVKLTKGREYRCLFNDETWTGDDEVVYESAISSVSFDGTKKTASFCDIFTASSGDLSIELDAAELGIVDEGQLNIFSETIGETSGNKSLILGHVRSRICVVESAGFVDQTVKVDGDNLETAGYIDYQIPMLNNEDEREFGFINPDSFYYTEAYNDIFTRGQRLENLTDKDNSRTGGLMYDGPMPASIKYIYPRCQKKNVLSFYISNDFWNGFIDRFETEDKYGSKSNRTKPTNINFTLQELVGGETPWQTITSAGEFLTATQGSRSGKTAYANVTYNGAEVGKTYRLVIGNEDGVGEEVEYYEDGDRHTFYNSLMRVPFSWKSFVFASDISSSVNVSRGDVSEHNISLIENHLLQKSISFPKEGISKLGSYNYRKEHPGFGFKVPYTRRYMYRLSHSLSAVYVDKLSHGGISRVEVTDPGSDYRIAPDVTVASPEEGTTATARAHIESGKLKFIQVTNNGSGYSDLSKLNTTKFINNSWGKGSAIRKEWLIQAAKFIYTFTLNGTKTVTHDGVKNIVLGSYASGTGIPTGTKVTKVNSSTEFEISHDATESGVRSLTIDLAERQMPYIPLEDQFGVETAEVTLKTINPALLPKSDPRYDNPCQESFGIDFQESEVLADYNESDAGRDLAAGAISSIANYVSLVEGATEDPNWLNVEDRSSLIGDLSEGENSSNVESKEVSAYGATTDDEYTDDTKGTEHPSVGGFYTAKEADEAEQTGTTVDEDGACQREVFPSVSSGTAKAVINNQSLAEYRVVENAIANTATPWVSSFSREENPSLPKGFGINPGSPLTSEVFNTFARAVNNMSLVGAYVPIFARVRKFRQYEYRYVDDMGGITFAEDNPTSAGGELSGGVTLEYGTWEAESKINFIEYIDPSDRKHKKAWFSADFGSPIEYGDKNIKNILDSSIDLYDKDTQVNEGFKVGGSYSPSDIGLPTVVNVPEELGVFCNPASPRVKEAGINLPSLNNRRASVFGGELVHSSEVYDVTDEDGRIVSSIVNIAGSDIIDTSYESEIIFGCQIRGKPFWSTFLKTTKEWTEFEVVPSPSFIDSISSDEGMGALTQLKGFVTRYTTLCDNKEFSKVKSNALNYNHSVCAGGRNDLGGDGSYSYERLFNLRDGDSVVGPVENSHEFIFDQAFGGQGTQVFKMEPEFTQALAVYGSHGYVDVVRSLTAERNTLAGPCIHKCSPGAQAVFNASDEQLIFDLKGGAKVKPLSSTTRMPRLVVFTDPKTGEKSYRYE